MITFYMCVLRKGEEVRTKKVLLSGKLKYYVHGFAFGFIKKKKMLSTNECISKWHKKSIFLSLPLMNKGIEE